MREALAAETLARPLLAPIFDRQPLADELVDAAIVALRQGTLAALVGQHPRATHWMLRHARRLVTGVAGEWLPPGSAGLVLQVRWMLVWAVAELRPDQGLGLDDIPRAAWAGQAAWRPVLALACHAGLLAVAEMPERYRRRPGESAADNLCGLWGVGPSTFYRCLDRAQAALARLSQQPLPVPMRLSLRAGLLAELQRAGHWPDEAARRTWHAARRQAAEQAGDMACALWHALQAGDAEAAVRCAGLRPAALATELESEALLERLAAGELPPRARFDLWLARALIARTRQAPERELAACQAALRLAETQGGELMRGEAYFALGRCHEARDGERARACYADSLQHLASAEAEAPAARVQAARLQTLARLALTQVRRNEPAARTTLDEADTLLKALGGADDLEALLAQAWGAYWRIGGEPERARSAWLHALNVFERLGDQRSVLATYRNLMLLHAEARDLVQLEICAQRIFAEAERSTLEPAILIGAHGNLGYGYSLAERYDRAIHHFRQSLALAVATRSDVEANRARCYLADACYYQFLKTGDAALESEADELVVQVLRAPESAITPTLLETARGLKAYVLGQLPQQSVDRVLEDEARAHLEAMAAIRRHREALAGGAAGRDKALAQLGIARAYLDIADRERQAAFALADELGLTAELKPQLQALKSYLGVKLSGPGALAERWRTEASDLLDEPRRLAVAERLLSDGELSKASYGEAATVSPATASKHLAMLTERGLLVQSGKGPSTRYRLVEPPGSPQP
jgi:DNA-binding transcriptional ArsR family regulator